MYERRGILVEKVDTVLGFLLTNTVEKKSLKTLALPQSE